MYNGIVAAGHRERERFWDHWQTFAKGLRVDPRLTNTPPATRVAAMGAFAAAVRAGQYSGGTSVRVQTVQVALRAIGTTIALDGRPNPCYQEGQGTYLVPLQRILTAYRKEDPPPEPKLAVPVTILRWLYQRAKVYDTPKKRLVARLCNIAFYFLLRSVEYSHTSKEAQTQPVCLGDITFWQGSTKIPYWADTARLSHATTAVIRIRLQKNGVHGETVTHFATHRADCPVRALRKVVQDIRLHTYEQSTPIYTYWNPQGLPRKVHATDITQAIRDAAKAMQLEKFGIQLHNVSSHSLRSGGAMALHLAGVPAHTIRLMGRWKSDAFLAYLHTQLSCFSEGLSSLMSSPQQFTNVAGTPSTKLPSKR